MSRLSHMEQQELVIQTIADELAQLEQIVMTGEVVSAENARQLEDCIAQCIRLRDLISKQAAAVQAENTPLPDWMRKSDGRSQTTSKQTVSRLLKQA